MESSRKKIKCPDLLSEMGAVDTSPRDIKYHDVIEFYCVNYNECGNKGVKKFGEAKRKRNGYAFKCRSCLNKSLQNRGDEWKKAISRSKKDAKRTREIINDLAESKKKSKNLKNVEDYWVFTGDLISIPVAREIQAVCKKCGITSAKPLKKFIEAASTETKGCANCHDLRTKTKDYSDFMKSVSPPAGSDARLKQGEAQKKFWENAGEESRLQWKTRSKGNWESLSADVKEIIASRRKEGFLSWLQSTPPEEMSEMRRKAHAGITPETLEDKSKSHKEWWASIEETEKNERIEKLQEGRILCEASKISKAEEEIFEWVRFLGLDVSRKLIGTKEIDIYIPSLNTGIEYNGIYWHSEKFADKNQHKDKMLLCRDNNIQLIQIFEHEWKSRKYRVMSYLKSKLGLNKHKVGARKVDFKWVDPSDVKHFVEKYHIQGHSPITKSAIAGYYNNQLIVACTFSRHHRDSSKMTLNRFVGKEDWTVMGGLSKMSKMGAKKHGEIISWCDLRWSDGSGYEKAGWTKEETLPPDYFYTDFKTVIPKQKRRKKAVNTPEGMTEREHALEDGLYRVYDCGKIRFKFLP